MVRLLFFFVLLCVFNACDSTGGKNPANSTVKISEGSLEGMVLVEATNSVAVLGTTNKSSKSNERPATSVKLDYDFQIGTHEVTCGEFRELMDEFPGEKCENDNLPMTNVTYYDAILFANARSKKEKQDTVYTYGKATFNSEGNCTNLEALSFKPNMKGYRLPTEAEWVLVASQNWKPENGWTLENSDNKLHEVCSAKESKDASNNFVCDMAGNALEWVNDWLGNFKDTLIYNYVGAPDGGSLGERVVKGGYYSLSASQIKLHSRGDFYTVASYKKEGYIGFRLAYGAIPDAVWMNSAGDVSESHFVTLANSGTIRRLTGSFATKLVFRNDLSGNLAYVDYSRGTLAVQEIKDSLDCYHPDISPDGNYVAFSTSFEGLEGESKVYVRKLDAEDKNRVVLDVENAAIPRWKVTADGDTVIVYVSSAGNNESDFKKNSTWQVSFKNGKFGTPEKLFDGSYHGGVSADGNLAVTGSTIFRSRIVDGSAVKETSWYDGFQACNVSLAKDLTKRSLFLDFGEGPGKDFIGSEYRVHEQIFIVDSLGELIGNVAAPKGYTFDHSEWALNNGYEADQKENVIAAVLVNSNAAHTKIVAVNVDDGSVTELVEGDELWHPCLWRKNSSHVTSDSDFDLDSAGVYLNNLAEDPLLSVKMNIFWQEIDSLKVVGLGSSRMSQGFAASNMAYGRSFNMATIPSDMDVIHYLSLNYVLNHCENLKVLVVGLDLDLWSKSAMTNVKSNILSFPGYRYDANHDFWKNQNVDVLKEIARTYEEGYPDIAIFHENMGWYQKKEYNSWTTGGFNAAALVEDSTWSNNNSSYERSLDELKEIIDAAGNKDVLVLGIVFPQSPYFKTTGALGRHGMRRSHAEKILERIKDMESQYSNFIMMDENKMGDHDYADELAYDYDHLNDKGGLVLTAKIDSLLKLLD